MSIRPLGKQKCPFVHWTNRNVHWTNRNVHWALKCPLDIHMSICPVDELKCPLDIQMSIRPMDERTLSNGKYSSLQSTWGQTQSLQLPWHCKCYICPLDINKSPFVHWANRNVHSSIGRTEMSIGHSNVHSSIGHSYVHSSIG